MEPGPVSRPGGGERLRHSCCSLGGAPSGRRPGCCEMGPCDPEGPSRRRPGGASLGVVGRLGKGAALRFPQGGAPRHWPKRACAHAGPRVPAGQGPAPAPEPQVLDSAGRAGALRPGGGEEGWVQGASGSCPLPSGPPGAEDSLPSGRPQGLRSPSPAPPRLLVLPEASPALLELWDPALRGCQPRGSGWWPPTQEGGVRECERECRRGSTHV